MVSLGSRGLNQKEELVIPYGTGETKVVNDARHGVGVHELDRGQDLAEVGSSLKNEFTLQISGHIIMLP
jgi:hypothetical protein